MKKPITVFILIITSLLLFVACSKTNNDSTFTITFIDVGQGDAALVECDKHYMLVEGENTSASTKYTMFLKRKAFRD